MKSKTWINRQKNDQFVKKAKQLGYINRAAFKLEEIEKKFSLIKLYFFSISSNLKAALLIYPICLAFFTN